MNSVFDFESSGGTTVLAPPEPRLRPLPKRKQAEPPPSGPPDDFDDSGGGGWSGGGGDDAGSGDEDADAARERTKREVEAGNLALGLILAGIATLFGVMLAVWLLLRRNATDWPPPQDAIPTVGLWMATLLLIGSSFTLEQGARVARNALAKDRKLILTWLGTSALMGVAFIGVQVGVLLGLWRDGLLPSSSGYGAVFYALTGLHGLHIVGGLCYILVLAIRLQTDAAFVAARHGIRLAAFFWHCMGILWVILFTLLYFVR